MRKRFLRPALLSSPIIALYGAMPIYILSPLAIREFMGIVIALTLVTGFIWVINIELIVRLPHLPMLWRNLAGYVLSSGVHYLFVYFGKSIEHGPAPAAYTAYPYLSVIAINTIIQLIASLVVSNAQREQTEDQLHKVMLSSLEAQRNSLVQQLQPHFLFNALSTLKALIRSNADTAEYYTLRLSEFLRYSVQASSHDVLSVREELKFTLDYIELQLVRFGNALDVVVDLPEATQGRGIPIFSLQTLVENAIKHNSFTEQHPLHIVISASLDTILVKNTRQIKYSHAAEYSNRNSPFESTREGTTSIGTGLSNLRRRYELLSGQPIRIESTETSFIVCLPLLDL
jgi:two-component system, LytTR family, sensor kinase